MSQETQSDDGPVTGQADRTAAASAAAIPMELAGARQSREPSLGGPLTGTPSRREVAGDDLSGVRARRRQREIDDAGANDELVALRRSLARDLQAPLRGLAGFGHVLAYDYGDRLDQEGRDYLRRVRETTELIERRVAALLALSEIGVTELSRTSVDVTAAAREVVRGLERGDPHHRAEVRIAAGLTAECDARLLAVVLTELIDNAWKFTAGQALAQITIGVQQLDGETPFFIRDTGVGFDMSYADRLFEPFQRLHGAEAFRGDGVGLATVYRIVTRHGGRVWAQSARGGGSTFYFTLGAANSLAELAG